MSAALTVREARPSDYDAWRVLWDGYNAFYERVGPTALPEAVTAATWSRFFDSYEPMHCLVAEDDGSIVGLVHFLYHRNTSMLGPTCYLQDLFTSEAARGRGAGRQLIEAVYERARAAGAGRVYWHTHHTNATARSLYDAVADDTGFLVYGKSF